MPSVTQQDTAPVVPSAVRVVFRGKRCYGTAASAIPAFYVKTVTPAAAGSDTTVSPGVGYLTYHDTALALFPAAAGDPSNKTALDALAVQVAKDFYAWAGTAFDRVYNGVINVDACGLYDEIIVEYGLNDSTTRIVTSPYNIEPEELMHHDPANSGCTTTVDPCFYVYGPPASCVSGHLTITRYKVCLIDGRLTYTFVSTDTIS